jgi:hypothetical protein
VEKANRGGPQILRTRDGDISLVGPPLIGPSYFAILEGENLEEEESIESFNEQTQLERGVESKELCCIGDSNARCRLNGENKKHTARKAISNLQNLPFSMLRKIPGGLQGARKKRKNKKLSNKVRSDSRVEGSGSEADDIQCSELVPSPPIPASNVGDGFQLEIVLPFHGANGSNHLCTDEGDPGGIGGVEEDEGVDVEEYQSFGSFDSEDEGPVSRETFEAKKLIAINENLGVKFHDGDMADVIRMVAMENRDRVEKVAWEQSRGNQ